MATTDVLLRIWVYDYLAQIFDGALGRLPEPPGGAGSPPWIVEARALRAALAQSPEDEVLADHARLFVNAPHGVAAPPYASWYLDGTVLGPSCADVDEAYARQGLARAADAGEPPDYIGAELEFLLFLARHELAARSTADDDALHVVLDSERDFVLSHVARWLPAFIAQIRAAAPGPVFSAAGDLLWAVMHDDLDRFGGPGSKATANAQIA